MKPKRNLTKINKKKTNLWYINTFKKNKNKQQNNWSKLTFKKPTAIKRTNQIYTLHWVVLLLLLKVKLYIVVKSY